MHFKSGKDKRSFSDLANKASAYKDIKIKGKYIMTGQEIANLLMEKGRVTNDVYYSIYYVLTLSPEHEKYDNESRERFG